MPRYRISVNRVCDELYEVDAPNEDAAERAYYDGEAVIVAREYSASEIDFIENTEVL